MWAELNTGTIKILKEACFTYCLAFYFLTMALTTVAKVSQLYTQTQSAVGFRSV